jgi:hypothetical protein
MAEPLESGREWVRATDELPPIQGPTNVGLWVRPRDGTSLRAWFKTPKPEFLPFAMYALGMERVAYVLGFSLGLPIPAIHLEPFEEQRGCLSLKAGGKNAIPLAWAEGRASRMCHNIVNESVWSLAVVFDVWIANIDRDGGHIMLDPVPAESEPHETDRCMSWLFDHEKSGLWWPRKIDPSATVGLDVEKLAEGDGSMTADSELLLRNVMPTRYRASVQALGEEARRPVLENVRRVSDDEISVAVEQVPKEYMSKTAKLLTVSFLAARRDRIDNLVRDVFTPS